MSKITFIIVVLALLAPCVLKGASIKTIKTLATNPHQKGVQLLTKKGYQCQTSSEVQTLNWHCLKQEKEISFTQSAIYTNCDALNLCHLGTQAALRSLFKGEPRAIKPFSVHGHIEIHTLALPRTRQRHPHDLSEQPKQPVSARSTALRLA